MKADDAESTLAWTDLGIPRLSAFADELEAPATEAEGAEAAQGAPPTQPQGPQAPLADDVRYRTAMLKVQQGAWPEAAELLPRCVRATPTSPCWSRCITRRSCAPTWS